MTQDSVKRLESRFLLPVAVAILLFAGTARAGCPWFLAWTPPCVAVHVVEKLIDFVREPNLNKVLGVIASPVLATSVIDALSEQGVKPPVDFKVQLTCPTEGACKGDVSIGSLPAIPVPPELPSVAQPVPPPSVPDDLQRAREQPQVAEVDITSAPVELPPRLGTEGATGGTELPTVQPLEGAPLSESAAGQGQAGENVTTDFSVETGR